MESAVSNPHVSIRKPLTEDISQIIEWLEGERHANAQDSVAEAAIPVVAGTGYAGETLVLVHADGTTVLAFASYVANQIELLSVRGEHRRQGYGKKLAERVIDEIRQSSTPWRRVLLECNPASSVPFWASLGFAQDPARPRIWMELDL